MNAPGEEASAAPVDAHCHPGAPRDGMRFVCAACLDDWPDVSTAEAEGDFAFFGVHPYHVRDVADVDGVADVLRMQLNTHPGAGVGEIGMDRLRFGRTDMFLQRPLFAAQLGVAAEQGRAVAVHGAKAWGETLREIAPYAGRLPAILFHGFSRAGGLVPEIAAMGGYFGIGPAVLNENAVNYLRLVRTLPRDRILAETDAPREDGKPAPRIGQVVAGVAAALGEDVAATAELLAANAAAFVARARRG